MQRRFSNDDEGSPLDQVVLSGSACLAKCPITEIDSVIVSTLMDLCRVEGADYAAWLLFGEGVHIEERLDTTLTTRRFRRASNFNPCALTWCRSFLIKGLPVIITKLAQLPGYADQDRAYFQSFGVQSAALIPVETDKADLGVLTILSLGEPNSWSSALARQCVLLGNSFLSARSRRVTDQERQSSDSNFREVFRTASVGMALEDTSGGLLCVNEALCAMLGYTEAEMVGRRCVDFSHPADQDREAPLFGELFRGERQGYEIEKRFLHRTGQTVWGKVSVTLLQKPSDRVSLVLGIVEDITRQKSALEELTQSQKEVQCLASRLILSQEDERRSIARELHDDIGQRLSIITSEVHLLHLIRAAANQPGEETLDRLTGDLDTLVTDLHNLSHRLHSSKLQHLGVGCALGELCKRVAGAGLHVDLTLGEELEPILEEAGTCLLRVAQEALSNVLKHSGAAEAFVILAKATGGYSLTVRDAGRGFDPKILANGLGLISMRERVRLVEGHIKIHSGPNEGTEIVVWVPRGASVN